MSTEDIAPLIGDDEELVSAASQFNNPIKTYDDAFGPLWVFRQSWGVAGIVRAQSWESAWEIVEDEILTPIPQEDLPEAYGYLIVSDAPLNPGKRTEWTVGHEDLGELGRCKTENKAKELCAAHILATEPDLLEDYSYQSNATGTGIVQHDLNGESLDALTPELLEQLQIKITIKDADDNERILGEQA